MKTGYGAALRWDLANGWDNGNDHGMFSYNEPDIADYTPHPAFYHLYYLQKYSGDVLLNSSMVGVTGVVIIPTAFKSGQLGASIVNTTKVQRNVRLNLKNYKVGERYYTYTLTGNSGEDFSRKVFVNGHGPSLVAGGPADYESIKANSSIINEEIVIKAPPLSATFILVESGTKELIINNEVTAVENTSVGDLITVYPNPSQSSFTVSNIPPGISAIEIKDLLGRLFYKRTGAISTSEIFNINLPGGVYFIILKKKNGQITKKIAIK